MITRFAAVLAAAGLLAGGMTPAVAAQKPPPLMKEKCQGKFMTEKRRKVLTPWAKAYDYYETHRKAEQVMYDNLRWFLADPNAQDSIPQLEAGAAQFLSVTQPIVAKDRDDNYRKLDAFQTKYLTNGCLPTKEGKRVFKRAVKVWRSNLQDIYAAEEQLFGMNMAIQTAQADLAGQYLTDAELEIATVEEKFNQAVDLFKSLY